MSYPPPATPPDGSPPGYGTTSQSYPYAPPAPAPYGQAPYDSYGPAPYGQAPYGPAPYGQAPYGPAPYGPAPYPYLPPAAPTNGLAIASMVLGILWIYWLGSILAVIFGHTALNTIKKTGQQGRGMAIAGLVLGYIGIATFLLLFIVGFLSAATGGTYAMGAIALL